MFDNMFYHSIILLKNICYQGGKGRDGFLIFQNIFYNFNRKPNLSLYSLYYAEAWNKFAVPISAS